MPFPFVLRSTLEAERRKWQYVVNSRNDEIATLTKRAATAEARAAAYLAKLTEHRCRPSADPAQAPSGHSKHAATPDARPRSTSHTTSTRSRNRKPRNS